MDQVETLQIRKTKSIFKAFARKDATMKKSRRIIALILALAFVFAFMAMNVSAATARGVVCDCGSSNTRLIAGTRTETKTVAYCSRVYATHKHTVRIPIETFKCYSCGSTYSYDTGSETLIACNG